MKKLMRITLGGLAASLLLAMLFACQSGTTGPLAGTNLNPDQRSTGDPPLIPHEIDQAEGNEVCQECHRTGDNGAPQYPEWHASLVDCQQCHVAATEGKQTFKTDY